GGRRAAGCRQFSDLDTEVWQNEVTLDRIFEFPDITRPVMVQEYFQYIWRQFLKGFSIFLCIFPDEIIAQKNDFLFSFTKRRDFDANDVEPEVEVVSKLAA